MCKSHHSTGLFAVLRGYRAYKKELSQKEIALHVICGRAGASTWVQSQRREQSPLLNSPGGCCRASAGIFAGTARAGRSGIFGFLGRKGLRNPKSPGKSFSPRL